MQTGTVTACVRFISSSITLSPDMKQGMLFNGFLLEFVLYRNIFGSRSYEK